MPLSKTAVARPAVVVMPPDPARMVVVTRRGRFGAFLGRLLA